MKKISFKNFRRTYFLGVCVLSASIILSSCSKNDHVQHIDEEPDKLSLQEFLSSIPEGEQDLIDGKIIDNKNFSTTALKKRASGGDVTTPVNPIESIEDFKIKLKVKFRWHGTGGGSGCNSTFGICAILSFSEQVVSMDPPLLIEDPIEDDPNSIAAIVGDKLIIKPTSLENGLTSDGYLPIGNYVPLNDEFMIKPGIYAGTPEEIIVDLVPIN